MKVKKNFRNKIVSRNQFIETCLRWRKKGIKVVFTNGCFDILHKGHVDYLYESSLKGQVLVIGLNTDSSIQRLKGKSRPIQSQESRSEVLAALEFVDLITFFEEETPENLIRSISPSVLVKGDDYQVSEISGSQFVLSQGGKVETVKITKGFSTSSIVERIRSSGNL